MVLHDDDTDTDDDDDEDEAEADDVRFTAVEVDEQHCCCCCRFPPPLLLHLILPAGRAGARGGR